MTFIGALLKQMDRKDLEQWAAHVVKLNLQCLNADKDTIVPLIMKIVPEKEILDSMTVDFLRNTCRKFHISGHSKLSKAGLIKLLREHENVLCGEAILAPSPKFKHQGSSASIQTSSATSGANESLDVLTSRICKTCDITTRDARRLKEFLCERVYPRLDVANADCGLPSIRQRFLKSLSQIECDAQFSKNFVQQLQRFFEILLDL